MTEDARIESLRREIERVRDLVDDVRSRVGDLEKEAGMTNKAIELEVKAIYQLAESLKGQFENYASSQVKETGKLSDSHEQILAELGEVRGRISVIQDKITQSEVEVNVGDNISAGGDYTGNNKTDGSGVIKWIVGAVTVMVLAGLGALLYNSNGSLEATHGDTTIKMDSQ